jgi:hypothetical protein
MKRRYPVVPGFTCRLLTLTSKMPGPSWSLPAGLACPRANGTICHGDASHKKCYAKGGCYKWSGPRAAQLARFKWTVDSMKTDLGRELWVDVMVSAIRRSKAKYFRVHDSGDLFSARYAAAWLVESSDREQVCRGARVARAGA